MRLLVLSCLLSVSFFSCKEKEDTPKTDHKEPFVYEMYQPSEMALLMEAMYEHSLKTKQEILDGGQPAAFPLEFLKIHSAEFSKGKGRNETFESFSKLFINAEKQIYEAQSDMDIKERFNNSVNLCITCHQTECTGPIPRIRKLLIQ